MWPANGRVDQSARGHQPRQPRGPQGRGRVSHVRLLMLINGIMDVRHTLQAVHQEDLIGEHLVGVQRRGEYPGPDD